MSNITSLSIAEPRNASDNQDLNFLLYVIGGVPIVKRKQWMRQLFPKTLGMLECAVLFDTPIRYTRGHRDHVNEHRSD